MRSVKRAVCALCAALLLCVLLPASVLAAESGTMWLSTAEADDGNAVVSIAADTTVTDGYVELSYDSSVFTYAGVSVNDTYVAMYSVNADTAGLVKIAWVAPNAWTSDGTAVTLLQVRFTGEADKAAFAMTGSAYDAQGNPVFLAQADKTALEAAVAKAEALNAELYTKKSFAVVESALKTAKAVLEDPNATQSEVDDATEALHNAIAGLKGSSGNSETGDNSHIMLVAGLMLLCAVGIVAVVVLMKKKGGRKE